MLYLQAMTTKKVTARRKTYPQLYVEGKNVPIICSSRDPPGPGRQRNLWTTWTCVSQILNFQQFDNKSKCSQSVWILQKFETNESLWHTNQKPTLWDLSNFKEHNEKTYVWELTDFQRHVNQNQHFKHNLLFFDRSRFVPKYINMKTK